MAIGNYKEIKRIVEYAIFEDLGEGDLTTDSLVKPGIKGQAFLIAENNGILAGHDVAAMVCRGIDNNLKYIQLVEEGSELENGTRIAGIEGEIRSILKAERTVLNFLQRLSGIATTTSKYVRRVEGTKAQITDTRKTTPGLRILEKYAVKVGGGRNHRYNLADGIIIKDNHLALLRSDNKEISDAVRMIRRSMDEMMKIEVEVESIDQAIEALSAGADIIMLDNMKAEDMRQVVDIVGNKALIEASGGITYENVRQVAETGVDFISIGALTHSVQALDITLELK